MADTKLADLTATTAPAATDIFYVVVDPGGTPLDRKVTLSNVLTGTLYAAATTDVFAAGVTGDTVKRFVANADGTLEWGPGNAALDVNLYRSGGNLKTDVILIGALDVIARSGAGSEVRIGARGPSLEAGVTLSDINVYRGSVAGGVGFAFDAHIGIADAKNIAVSTTTGTKIGTATTQKLGFYNATPVVQGASIADPGSPGALYVQAEAVAIRDAVVSLISRLEDTGLIATV